MRLRGYRSPSSSSCTSNTPLPAAWAAVSRPLSRGPGAGKRDVANALVLHTLVLALGLATVFSIALLLSAPTVFRWMGGHGAMLAAAMSYANVALSAAISICMPNLLGSAVRGTGIITNLSVVLLTAIAGQLGKETAIGYALGARLEYILIPLAFGFGTSIVAMVGTNRGARQYRRAREVAWTGAGTVAATCAVIGIFFAIFPRLWLGPFQRR